MLKSSHPNVVESDEGFSVQVLGGGRLGIVYREGNLAIKVLSESAVDPIGYIIYKNSIREWALPGSGKTIDDQTRERILLNLRRAFLYQGYQIEVNETSQFSDETLLRLQKLDE